MNLRNIEVSCFSESINNCITEEYSRNAQNIRANLDAIALVVEQKYRSFKLIKKRTEVEHEFDIKKYG